MGIEIERKFLVRNSKWKSLARGTFYRQGYVCNRPDRTVRIRTDGKKGILTIKGESSGITRPEFEFSIPVDDAMAILEMLCDGRIIEKTRYCIDYAGFVWEIDEFHGANSGLVLAEIELQEVHQPFELPAWIGDEVTGDPRYYNAYLARHPYTTWNESDE